MSYLKKLIVLLLITFSFGFSFASAGSLSESEEINYCKDDDCGVEQGMNTLKKIDDFETERKASEYIQDIVLNILGYIYLLALILVIYGGFLILTSTGEEEKVKKGKNIIIFTIIGIIVIYLASPLVEFIVGVILG